jgi:hypothetical protein
MFEENIRSAVKAMTRLGIGFQLRGDAAEVFGHAPAKDELGQWLEHGHESRRFDDPHFLGHHGTAIRRFELQDVAKSATTAGGIES